MNRISDIQGDLIVVPAADLRKAFTLVSGSKMVIGLKRL